MIKAAKASEAPVTDWEAFEGEAFGFDHDGNRIVEISRAITWAGATTRGWAALYGRNVVAHGTAGSLREAKTAALAALRAV